MADAGDIARFAYAGLTDREFQEQTTLAARRAVDLLGGALERTLNAIDPYLLQIRLEGK